MRARVLGVLLLVAAAISGALALSASSAPRKATASAGAAVLSGTGGPAVTASTEQGRRTERASAISRRGVEILSGEAVATRAVQGLRARAGGRALARGVTLLDGLVRARSVSRRITASRGATSFSGVVRRLRIGDQDLGDVEAEQRFRLPAGAGTVTLNAGARGLVVHVERDTAGVPAGTEIVVAEVSARARDGIPAAPEPTPTATPHTRDPGVERTRKRRRAAARRERAAVERLSAGDFSFPVYGDADTADDFGAARQIGAHQGNDVFAPFGAPVLAVADGRVEKVGTLPISGNRLWLRTDDGDTFFYAHLSAFAPAAVSGRRVRLGTLLGFVGNTGDAEPTPPHVHFEIHPGDGDAVDPHAVLAAWAQRPAAAPKGWLARYGADTEQRPGALVEVRDLIAGG